MVTRGVRTLVALYRNDARRGDHNVIERCRDRVITVRDVRRNYYVELTEPGADQSRKSDLRYLVAELDVGQGR